MTENESVKFFLRIVQEKHTTVNQRLTELFQALASDNHNEKVKANELLLGACEDLATILANSDRPKWLDQFINETKLYSSNHQKSGHNFRLLNSIVNQKNSALSHAWSFEQSNIEVDYNFDSVYELFKKTDYSGFWGCHFGTI